MKRVTLILMGLLMLAVLPSSVVAEPSPGVHYERSELTYVIDENLAVRAQLGFTLLNQTGSSWDRSENRTILTPDVADIEVQDSLGGRVNHAVQQNPENTVIQIDYIIHPGEWLNYTISYKALGLVSKDGPKYQLLSRLGAMSIGAGGWPHDNFVVTVQGLPSAQLFLYEPADVTLNGENIRYETRLEPPVDFDGVRGTWYASPAHYRVNLERSISNPGPDTTTSLRLDVVLFNNEDNWQFSSLVESNPLPEAVYVDEENNWHGVFEVGAISPSETKALRLNLIYQANVHDPEITAAEVGALADVPAGLEIYLEPLQYWESDNQIIQNAASTAVAGETKVYLAAQKIVDFVGNHLEHHSQTTRHGAVHAYQNPTDADCSEYTDLSIALARAARIPARASYGWGYEENELTGHAWLEFYFPGVGWQPADPTWADASGDYFGRLDSIHIQRSLRGLESTEGYMTYTYRGEKPEISQEPGKEVVVLTETEAAADFLSAADLAIDLAANLLEGKGGGENLNQELSSARALLEQAENASDADQKLALSQQAIQHANVIIQELGEPPAAEVERPWINLEDLLMITTIAVVIIVISGGIWHAIKKKAGHSSVSSWS